MEGWCGMADETPCKCPPRAPAISAGLTSLPRQRGSFSQVRAATLRDARAKQPLSFWRAEEGELGLLLAEAWAYVSDAISMYDSLIAEEPRCRVRGTTSSAFLHHQRQVTWVPPKGCVDTDTGGWHAREVVMFACPAVTGSGWAGAVVFSVSLLPACGPAQAPSPGAVASTTTDASSHGGTVESGDAVATEASGTPDAASDDAAALCPDVTIEQPFPYHGYCLARDDLPEVAGRFGPAGEPALAFIGGGFYTPWEGETVLLRWDGTSLTEEHFDTVAWAGLWLPATLSDLQRDDLLGEALEDGIHVIPNSAGGLQPSIAKLLSGSRRNPVAAIDLDADGFDEIVAGYSVDADSFTRRLEAYRWSGTTWEWFGDLGVTPDECRVTSARRLELNGDGRPDLALVTACGPTANGGDAFVTMVATPRPLAFETTFWPELGGNVRSWYLADFDADGRHDMVYELVDLGPRRLEIVLVPGDGSLSQPTPIWLDDHPVFVDGHAHCVQGSHPWIPVHVDDDGRSELMCGRTLIDSPLELPTAIEALPAGLLGSTVSPQIAAHDLTGDGVDEIVVVGRDSLDEPRTFVLVAGE